MSKLQQADCKHSVEKPQEFSYSSNSNISEVDQTLTQLICFFNVLDVVAKFDIDCYFHLELYSKQLQLFIGLLIYKKCKSFIVFQI